jgi:hypothetical protein
MPAFLCIICDGRKGFVFRKCVASETIDGQRALASDSGFTMTNQQVTRLLSPFLMY